MPYPFSSNVAAGQQTQASQYNNLRKDALFLGAEPANSASLGAFLGSIAFTVPETELKIFADTNPPASATFWPTNTWSPLLTIGCAGAPMC